MKLILIAALLISSVAYQQEIAVNQKTDLDHEFKIKIGQEVSVDKLRIKFDAVAGDKRCACGEQCSSHRNAMAIFRVESPQNVSKCIVLTAYSEPDETRSRGYRISLLRLDPCPQAHGSPIDSREYEATLLITKSLTESGPDQNSNERQQGQSKPTFSGTWLHREALDAGATLTISHNGPEMKVISSRFARASRFITEKIYRIDGQSHITTQIDYAEKGSTKQKQDYKTSSFKSLAGWEEDKIVIVENSARYEWKLSENGRHLILTTGTRKVVYQKRDKG